MRKAKTNYFIQLIGESGGNRSYLWKHINTILNHKPNQYREIKELNIGGVVTTDIKEIANELNIYFIQSESINLNGHTSNFQQSQSGNDV